ncbi:hypothetical protein, partial [Chryseobacterium gambrini]|uniref:hypothetical protein n=1 Tax=Chryseobacterium gambrini TaxID=373672 RepID=UPI0025B370C3
CNIMDVKHAKIPASVKNTAIIANPIEKVPDATKLEIAQYAKPSPTNVLRVPGRPKEAIGCSRSIVRRILLTSTSPWEKGP